MSFAPFGMETAAFLVVSASSRPSAYEGDNPKSLYTNIILAFLSASVILFLVSLHVCCVLAMVKLLLGVKIVVVQLVEAFR